MKRGRPFCAMLASAVLAVTVLCVSAGLLQGQYRGELRADEISIAGVMVGSDSIDAIRGFGEPDSSVVGIGKDDRYPVLVYDGLSISIYFGGVVGGFSLRSPRFATKRGLRVGDSLERVVELYGQPEEQEGSYWTYISEAEFGHAIVVTVGESSVDRIWVGIRH